MGQFQHGRKPGAPGLAFDTWDSPIHTIPHFAADPGSVKLLAGWLIEQAGFPKGFALGEAGVSSRHTLAIVNRGNATAKEVLALRDEIRKRVLAQFGICLEQEPVYVSGA